MKFVDEAEVELVSGRGGRGMSSFRREKFVPKGGPDGGDGGEGGGVYLMADSSMGSLLDFRHKKRIKAKDGESGMSANKHGKRGESITLKLPHGTQVFDVETGELLADLVTLGEKVLILEGGQGGRGNSRFATSTNRVPTYCQPGIEGERKKVRFELKVMADVGLLGFPNAGKSTLISRISAARPKIADYPFTTLVPNLGVVNWSDDKTFVVADIPGIIEGASEGAGLGIQFLKHLERTRYLLHLVDPVDEQEPLEKYKLLRGELKNFSPELALMPEQVVITKADVVQDQEELASVISEFNKLGIKPMLISALSGLGLKELVRATGNKLSELAKEEEDG